MTRILVDSYLCHHPGARVFVCIVDEPDSRVPYDEMPFEPVFAAELGIPGFSSFSFRYDILELNTAVKPYLLMYLRDHFRLDRVFYFDPDILVHDRLTELEEALESNLAVVTPHLTRPLDNTYRPPERVIRMCGIYNLGFIGLRLDQRTAAFLEWWCERLNRFCAHDIANGMFVDQSWMDFAPAYLESVAIVRSPIFNIAYWNLPHRHPQMVDDHWEVEGRRVGFFHFSGVNVNTLDMISVHQDRLDLFNRPDLRPLFEHYRDLVLANDHRELSRLPYHYKSFRGTDIDIPKCCRIALQETDPAGLRWPDPFAVDGNDSYLQWLTEKILLPTGALNRAVLFLWRDNEHLRHAFPRVLDEDLPHYVYWLLHNPDSKSLGMPQVFLAGFEVPSPGGTRGSGSPTHSIDLAHPGPYTEYLNQPLPTGSAAPIITRLALHLHETASDLKQHYPDPLGADQREFAYWMVRFGAARFGLHPSLLEPLRSSLDRRTRFAVGARQLVARHRGRTPGFTIEVVDANLGIEKTEGECTPVPLVGHGDGSLLGVNVLGHFKNPYAGTPIAPGSVATLAHAGIPSVKVCLDTQLPAEMTCDRIRLENGAPFPVTLAHCSPDELDSALRLLPLGTRVAQQVIAFWSPEEVDPDHPALLLVDEIWTATEEGRVRLVAKTKVPVRCVPPAIVASDSATSDRSRFGLDPDVFYFYVPLSASVEAGAVAAVIDGLAGAQGKRCHHKLGVVLDTGGTGVKTDNLGSAVVTFNHRFDFTIHQGLVMACDAVLAPAGTESCRIALAMMLGKPVAASGSSRTAALVDSATACQVQSLRGGAQDREEVAAAMLEISRLGRRVTQRVERARSRALELYSPEAAAPRYAAALSQRGSDAPRSPGGV